VTYNKLYFDLYITIIDVATATTTKTGNGHNFATFLATETSYI